MTRRPVDAAAESRMTVTVRPVIVRACVLCGEKRELEMPCASCGNPMPPVTHDLGIQAAEYNDPLKQLMWNLFGKPAADRRAVPKARRLLS